MTNAEERYRALLDASGISGKFEDHRPYLLLFNWIRRTLVVFVCHLVCVALLAGTVHALDPNKRLTQYIHTSWRTQDGSLPAGMYSIAQTSDGFLWFLSLPGDIYRFDGVRFLPWRLPAGVSIRPIGKSLPTTQVGSG